MNQKQSDQVFAKINNYIPELITDFIEDREANLVAGVKKSADPETMKALISTLKNWANPDNAYTDKLSDADLANLKYISDCLKDPRLIFDSKQNIESAKLNDIRLSLQAKLDEFANQLIAIYHLDNMFNLVDEKKIQNWWDQKSGAEQQRIRENFSNLSEDMRCHLLVRANEYYQSDYDNLSAVPDVCWYYWLSTQFYYLPHVRSRAGDFITPVFVPLSLYPTFHTTGHHGISGGHGGVFFGRAHQSGVKDGGVYIPVVILGMMFAGLIGGTYAVKKSIDYIIELLKGQKILRNLYRLIGTAGSAYGGVIAGMLMGAAIGSAYPGIGTVAGAIFGAIFMGGAAAGLGALITKYSAKLFSYLAHRDEVNSTNPDKYRLTVAEKSELKAKGFDVDEVARIMETIYIEKNSMSSIDKVLPWEDAHNENKKLNELLKQVRTNLAAMPNDVIINNAVFHPYKLHMMSPEQSSQVFEVSDKYKLSPKQRGDITGANLDMNTINKMLIAIHREVARMQGRIGIKVLVKKMELNFLLHQLTSSPESLDNFPIKIGKIYYDPRILETEKVAKADLSTAQILPKLEAEMKIERVDMTDVKQPKKFHTSNLATHSHFKKVKKQNNQSDIDEGYKPAMVPRSVKNI